MSERVDWHTYFMNIAHQAATRSTCDRKHVGGSRSRQDDPVDGIQRLDPRDAALRRRLHLMEDGHRAATVHAEANAIIQAAKTGCVSRGGNLHDRFALLACFKLITNAGIRTIYYGEFYRDVRSADKAAQLGIHLID
jgi:dCMP deaminase